MDNETRQRIEDKAIEYGQKVMEKTKDSHDGINAKYAYIAGAETEHSRITELLKEERNKAIDECLNEVKGMEERSCDDAFKFAYKIVVDSLNRLKGKQQ